jgi:hypothetical protein
VSRKITETESNPHHVTKDHLDEIGQSNKNYGLMVNGKFKQCVHLYIPSNLTRVTNTCFSESASNRPSGTKWSTSLQIGATAARWHHCGWLGLANQTTRPSGNLGVTTACYPASFVRPMLMTYRLSLIKKLAAAERKQSSNCK